MSTKTGPVLSVVDYDAWNKGYMPPSEHILIDKLAYRGARVNLSTPISKDHQLWVVVEGPPMTSKQRRLLMEVMKIWFDDEDEEQERTLPAVAENGPALKPYDPPVESATDGSNACGKTTIADAAPNSTDTGSVT